MQFYRSLFTASEASRMLRHIYSDAFMSFSSLYTSGYHLRDKVESILPKDEQAKKLFSTRLILTQARTRGDI